MGQNNAADQQAESFKRNALLQALERAYRWRG
jgi:hypothetical protein